MLKRSSYSHALLLSLCLCDVGTSYTAPSSYSFINSSNGHSVGRYFHSFPSTIKKRSLSKTHSLVNLESRTHLFLTSSSDVDEYDFKTSNNDIDGIDKNDDKQESLVNINDVSNENENKKIESKQSPPKGKKIEVKDVNSSTGATRDEMISFSEDGVGAYDPAKKIPFKREVIVGNPQIKLKKEKQSVAEILTELAAIQKQGPQKYCILGSRHISYLHQQIIELL